MKQIPLNQKITRMPFGARNVDGWSHYDAVHEAGKKTGKKLKKFDDDHLEDEEGETESDRLKDAHEMTGGFDDF